MDEMEAINMPDGRSEWKADGSGSALRYQGVLVKPNAGFVIKSRLSKSSTDRLADVSVNRHYFQDQQSDHNISLSLVASKIFINVCFHDAVARPRIMKKLNESGEEVEGLNVPVSIGDTRMCMDKAGFQNCIVVDVILSSEVQAEIKNEAKGVSTYRDFVCDIVIQSVEDKHRKMYGSIDRNFKVPKLTYFGYVHSKTGEITNRKADDVEIASQWVKDLRDLPSIEEVKPIPSLTMNDYSSNHVGLQINQVLATYSMLIKLVSERTVTLIELSNIIDEQNGFKNTTCNEGYKFYFVDWALLKAMNDPIESVVIEVTFSAQIHLSSFQVYLSAYQAFFECYSFTPLIIPLPFQVKAATVSCIYYEENLKAVMTARISQSYSTVEPDIGTSPWILRQLVSTGENQVQTNESGIHRKDEFSCLHSLNRKVDFSNHHHTSATLPEDRFHYEDAVSMFYLDQQQGGVKNDKPANDLLEIF